MNICIRNRQASDLSLQARSKLLNVVLVESVAVEVKTEKKGVNLTNMFFAWLTQLFKLGLASQIHIFVF